MLLGIKPCIKKKSKLELYIEMCNSCKSRNRLVGMQNYRESLIKSGRGNFFTFEILFLISNLNFWFALVWQQGKDISKMQFFPTHILAYIKMKTSWKLVKAIPTRENFKMHFQIWFGIEIHSYIQTSIRLGI